MARKRRAHVLHLGPGRPVMCSKYNFVCIFAIVLSFICIYIFLCVCCCILAQAALSGAANAAAAEATNGKRGGPRRQLAIFKPK